MKSLVFGKNSSVVTVAEAYASAKAAKAERNARQAVTHARRVAAQHAAALPQFVAVYTAAATAQAELNARAAARTTELKSFVDNGCKTAVTAETHADAKFKMNLQRFADAEEENGYHIDRYVSEFMNDVLNILWKTAGENARHLATRLRFPGKRNIERYKFLKDEKFVLVLDAAVSRTSEGKLIDANNIIRVYEAYKLLGDARAAVNVFKRAKFGRFVCSRPDDLYEVIGDYIDYLDTEDIERVTGALVSGFFDRFAIEAVLKAAFKKHFNRVPRVVSEMAQWAEDFFGGKSKWVNLIDFAKEFQPRVFASDLKMSEGDVFLAFGWYLASPKKAQKGYDIDAIKYVISHNLVKSSVHDWLMEHKNLSYENCMFAINHEKNLDFSLIHSIDELKEAVAQLESQKDLIEFQEVYNIRLNDLVTEIEPNTVSFGKDVACMLEATDPTQLSIGYDTYCCQHMGGAGETAMVYGLISPNGGFFVVRRNGKVIAQAESWLAREESTLVFDNIELANDREVTTIFPVLKKWLENSNYSNVVMGLGYNEVGEAVNLPKAPIPKMRDLKKIEDFINDEVYTDADEACVYLKKNGKVMF